MFAGLDDEVSAVIHAASAKNGDTSTSANNSIMSCDDNNNPNDANEGKNPPQDKISSNNDTTTMTTTGKRGGSTIAKKSTAEKIRAVEQKVREKILIQGEAEAPVANATNRKQFLLNDLNNNAIAIPKKSAAIIDDHNDGPSKKANNTAVDRGQDQDQGGSGSTNTKDQTSKSRSAFQVVAADKARESSSKMASIQQIVVKEKSGKAAALVDPLSISQPKKNDAITSPRPEVKVPAKASATELNRRRVSQSKTTDTSSKNQATTQPPQIIQPEIIHPIMPPEATRSCSFAEDKNTSTPRPSCTVKFLLNKDCYLKWEEKNEFDARLQKWDPFWKW